MFAMPMMMKPAAGGGVDDPSAIFGADLLGWWEADIAYLYQDTGATTPVTATGQTVYYIGDKSGNGRNLLRVAGTPTYEVDGDGKPYIALSGTEWFDTSSVAWLGSGVGFYASAAAYVTNFSAVRSLFDLDPGSSRVAQIIRYLNSTGAVQSIVFPGPVTDSGPTASATTKHTVTARSDGTSYVEALLNGTGNGSTAITSLSATSQPLRLGARLNNSQPFSGRFFGGFFVDRDATSGEAADAETYLGTLI